MGTWIYPEVETPTIIISWSRLTLTWVCWVTIRTTRKLSSHRIKRKKISLMMIIMNQIRSSKKNPREMWDSISQRRSLLSRKALFRNLKRSAELKVLNKRWWSIQKFDDHFLKILIKTKSMKSIKSCNWVSSKTYKWPNSIIKMKSEGQSNRMFLWISAPFCPKPN